MKVYRICKAQYADKLIASGQENRWNIDGMFVLYTASSISLACLENLVHTSGLIVKANRYKLLEINIPPSAKLSKILLKNLPGDWTVERHRERTQKIGIDWYGKDAELLLQTPSAIIPEENNYLINTRHAQFSKVKISASKPFEFDGRLLQKA